MSVCGFTQPADGQQIEPLAHAARPLQLQMVLFPSLTQTSPSLHATASHVHRCVAVLQLAPEIPLAASHCEVVEHPQLPPKQVNLDKSPPCDPQLLPHAPQSVLSVVKLVSQPSSGRGFVLSLQLPYPGEQVGAQLPASQVLPDALVAAHERPHLPQCRVSPVAFSAVSQPLVATPSQFPQVLLVQLMPHALFTHAAVALGWPLGHGAHDVDPQP